MSIRIKEVRKEKGLTQAQLSKLTGISQPMICMMELAGRRPRETSLKKLAKVFGCRIEDLIDDDSKSA